MFVFPIPGLWQACQELEEIRRRYLLGSAKSQVRHRCLSGRAQEPVLGFPIQEQLHSDTKEAKGVLLV